MYTQRKNQPSRTASAQMKLYTIHGLLRGRVFDGTFAAHRKIYSFSFVPKEATIVEQKLVLTGRLGFSSPRQEARFVDGVRAKLVATQGGVGVSPVRRQLLTGTAQTAQTATSDQKLEQEKGPETELQPGLHAFESPNSDESGRPTVESTGSLAFVGVLYFQLSPLDGETLGVPLDLSHVQLGGRLSPTDDLSRDLQLLFSDLVLALDSKTPDEQSVQSYLSALNLAFGSSGRRSWLQQFLPTRAEREA
jgi:hypothetical protein